MAMKLSLGSLVAIGVSASLATTVACSAKIIEDMGSNAASTGGTNSIPAPSTGGATSSVPSTGGATSSTPGTGGAPAQSFEIIAGDSTIFEITADSGWVYWPAADSNSSSTQSSKTLSIRSYSAGADAGAVNTNQLATVLPSPYMPPSMLKIDGDWMYWIAEAYDVNDIGRLYRCHNSGCSDVQNMGMDAGWYAVADGELYWSSGSDILSCDADNCATTTRTIDVQTPAGQPKFQGGSMLAVDGDYLYMQWGGGLARVPRAGSAPYEPIEPGEVYEYFVHGDQIYWTENAKPYAVYSCPKSGCTGDPTPVMRNIVYGQHIAHDDDTIYVLDVPSFSTGGQGGWRLLRCPITGCDQPAVVLGEEFNPFAVASDNEHIFAVVGSASKGLPNVNQADYCSASGCAVVLMMPK